MISGLIFGVLGLMNLFRVTPSSGYLTFLPTLLGLGIGMGLLTAAVVAAAVSGVPAKRSGIASGVNNTARQAFGAIGVAMFGAVVGEPTNHAAFISGLHMVGIIGGALWLSAIVLTAVSVRSS
jgi:DHA2 family methylenomycin A resistance protein-like MFS transporter